MLILTVSYDRASLNRQIQELEASGHVIVPSSSLDNCLNAIAGGPYQLLVIGPTVMMVDRMRLADVSRKIRPEARIVSIEHRGSPNLKKADYRIQAGHEYELIEVIDQLQYKRYL
ncbi:MAG: hypothetical protein ACJ71Q_16545 [Terriglobales bacterium]